MVTEPPNEACRWNYSTFSMLSVKHADETVLHISMLSVKHAYETILHIFNVSSEACRWNCTPHFNVIGPTCIFGSFPFRGIGHFQNMKCWHFTQVTWHPPGKWETLCSCWRHYNDILTAGMKTMLTHVIWSQSHTALHFTHAWYSSTEAHQEDTEMDKIIISNVYDTGTCTRTQERQANKTVTDRQSCRTSSWSCEWHRRQNL